MLYYMSQTYVPDHNNRVWRKGEAFHITHTWSVDNVDKYRKIKQIAGHGHVSTLIERLLLEWLQEQQLQQKETEK